MKKNKPTGKARKPQKRKEKKQEKEFVETCRLERNLQKINPSTVIKKVPDISVFNLPEDWFEELDPIDDIYSQLHDWVKTKIGRKITYEQEVYIGIDLHNKIIKTKNYKDAYLGKHARNRCGWGPEVSFGSMWNGASCLAGGGRKDTCGCFCFSGESIIVPPEGPGSGDIYYEPFYEYVLKITRKQVDKYNEKIKNNAGGTNFYDWLACQQDRRDYIGDISRDIDELEITKEMDSCEEILRHIWGLGKNIMARVVFRNIRTCFIDAWDEYLEKYPERTVKYIWCDSCNKKINFEQTNKKSSTEKETIYLVIDNISCKSIFDDQQQIEIVERINTGSIRFFQTQEESEAFLCQDCVEEIVENSRLIYCPPLPTKERLWIEEQKNEMDAESDDPDKYLSVFDCFMLAIDIEKINFDFLDDLKEQKIIHKYDIESVLNTLQRWRILSKNENGTIYFIKTEDTPSVKIGFTSKPIEQRLANLQTSSPSKLSLLATLPGNRDYEKALHKKFSKYRLEGEWFEFHPDIIEFISVINKSNETNKAA